MTVDEEVLKNAIAAEILYKLPIPVYESQEYTLEIIDRNKKFAKEVAIAVTEKLKQQ